MRNIREELLLLLQRYRYWIDNHPKNRSRSLQSQTERSEHFKEIYKYLTELEKLTLEL